MSKFKNTEELEKAYQELEREFTKKSQKLALYEKTNYVTLLNNEIDSLVDDYAKRKISNLEAKLAESEKSKESYRLQNEHHHLQLLQFYSRLGVEAFGADIHEKALETLMIMKEQLAEKEKEISEYIKIVDDLHKQLSDKCDFCDKTKDQDKISFAVEQLEIARKLIDELLDNCGDKQYKVWEVFDSQIKQLNEGK